MAPKKRERCLQEVQLLQACKHPNIIQMLEAFIDDNMLIIVFEWAPAGDLKRLIKKTAEAGKLLEESLIWNYFFQIADAVRYMHKLRIMHRDIKPANVLVGANGALKLGDLGLGRHFSEHTNEAFSKVGTPYYVSPEVVKGIGYDWKSDVWSLGCLLYELACLRSPFETEGANLYEVFQKINAGDYTPLPQDRHSTVLRNLTQRMLQTDPELRPEMEEVWQVTRSVFDHQHQASRSTHLTCELAMDKITLLATEVQRQRAAREMLGGAAEELPLPGAPLPLLASLHPLFFAEPDTREGRAKGGRGAGSGRQFRALLGLVSWLLQLSGRGAEAGELERELRLLEDGGGGLDEASRVRLGDRVRVAATALGLDADFSTAQGIAAGCGRTASMLLDGLAALALKGLNIRARRPTHEAPPAGGGPPDAEILEDLELPEAALLGPDSYAVVPEDDDQEQQAYHHRHGGRPATAIAAAAAERAMIVSQVDAGEWAAEAERVAPRLGRITLRAEGSGRFGAWAEHRTMAARAREGFLAAQPGVEGGAAAWRAQLGEELEALDRREEYVNREWATQASAYAAARTRLSEAIAARDAAEEAVSGATGELAELQNRLASVEAAMEERQADFDGARPLLRIREALTALEVEMSEMVVRAGVAHAHLLVVQKQVADERLGRRH
mmetsp:Transcript_46378/g.115984  ORF Transcript_46378/g.115984 Transcript_46378/m.115984 type:complete len:671 (+) Transcript_46378:110-2122(+)